MAAVFLVNPSKRLVLATFLSSIAVTYFVNVIFETMNYFVRSSWVIVLTFAMVTIPIVLKNGWRIPLNELLLLSSRSAVRFGTALLASLVLCHVIFH